MRGKILPLVRDLAELAVGVVLMALAYPLFFLDSRIAPGGLTGVARVINRLWRVPGGLMAFLLNLPLFLISFFHRGSGFVLRSFAAMVCVSAIIDLAPVPAITGDPLLAAIAGGVLLGVGLGLVIRSGATTGGTDMAASLLHGRFPALSVGGILLGIDFLVILLAGIVFDMEAALYSLAALYLSARLVDQVVEGLNPAKAFSIISNEHRPIASAILQQMARGVTLLQSRGAYSGAEGDVLLCVVTRLQTMQLKRIVASVDPRAFVIVTDVHEVMGEGFSRDGTAVPPAGPPWRRVTGDGD